MATPEILARTILDRDSDSRRALLRADSSLHRPGVVRYLIEQVLSSSRSDPVLAKELAADAAWLAEQIGSDHCRGVAAKAQGHMLALEGNYSAALERYERAVEVFGQIEEPVQVARTLSAALQPLHYLGRYEEAAKAAERARRVFEAHREVRRLGQLEVNLANLDFRRDRSEEALDRYQRALDLLADCGSARDVGVILRNILVCQTSIGRFEDALNSYREAKEHCQRHDLGQLAVECDYNIAYLHYLQGDYSRALELYKQTRELSEQVGDRYHRALCDLDQAEVYLELNLLPEARDLAKAAFHGFEDLGIVYEAAKALVYLGVAASRSHRPDLALGFFDRSRALFDREGNQVWLAMIELHRAAVLAGQGDYEQARLTAESARRFFADSPFDSKAALCEILLGELKLADGDASGALRHCAAASDHVSRTSAPIISSRMHMLSGDAYLARGERHRALHSFGEARAIIENLRAGLASPALRIGFVQNRAGVYSRLFALGLDGAQPDPEAAFLAAELAKSRHVLDMRAGWKVVRATDNSAFEDRRLGDLRARLNALYRLADAAELGSVEPRSSRLQAIRHRIAEQETALLRATRDVEGGDPRRHASTGPVSNLSATRAALREGQLLLEYFEANDRFFVMLVSADGLEAVPLAPVEAVRVPLELLRFQLSKFRLGSGHGSRLRRLMSASVTLHLEELHRLLIEPVRSRLDAEHLIVVPHGLLHYVPFHALEKDAQPLIADFVVSYAPSASVYVGCLGSREPHRKKSLVMAVADPRAPAMESEAADVAESLGDATVLTGAEATANALRERGPGRRVIHLAAHGRFRRDNPMFSAIQLADSRLSLLDLHQMRLPSDFVVLSGCGTGLAVIKEGDEVLSLVSGVLAAGARSVLMALWDLADEPAARFIRDFYGRLQTGTNKARALQETMLAARSASSHPYFWAPFALVGDSSPIAKLAGSRVPTLES